MKSLRSPDVRLLPGESIDDKWKRISRNGADAAFNISGNTLEAKVSALGQKPWDLQLEYKEKLKLQKGQSLNITMEYKGPEMKMNLNTSDNKRATRIIKASKNRKKQTITIPISLVWTRQDVVP